MLLEKEYMSGEDMSRRLGISRVAVWKKIEGLRGQGWQIESGGRRGYRLVAGDRLDPVLWQGRLDTAWCGRGRVYFFQETGSTNQVLKGVVMEDAPHGTLALAEKQTAGRGRLGRQWVSEPGAGLWQSLLLRPSLAPAGAPFITLAAALSMCEALEELGVRQVRIKWPNDLVLNSRKIVGILTEASLNMDSIESVIVGVGLNVRRDAVPPELEKTATSLENEGYHLLRRDILVAYLRKMEAHIDSLEREGFGAMEEAYRERSCTLGSRVEVISASETFQGMARKMDGTGALLVEDDAGQLRRVLAGDVSVRGVMGYV